MKTGEAKEVASEEFWLEMMRKIDVTDQQVHATKCGQVHASVMNRAGASKCDEQGKVMQLNKGRCMQA